MKRRLVVDLNDARPLWTMPGWVVERVRAALPEAWEVEVVGAPADGRADGGGGSAEARRAIRGAEVYIGYGVTPELFRAATEPPDGRLRWVHSAAAGVGGSLFPAMLASEVVLTNSAGVHAEPIAETVLAMLLHFARGLDLAVAAQREARWALDEFTAAAAPVVELGESTVGVVGYGGIGRAVARRAAALGSRVVAWKRTPAEAGPGVELRTGAGALEALLAESDFVVVTLPHTTATHRLIDAAAIARMRAGAVLVNVGRGAVLDEAALAAALAEGRLRGAALDVFEREPLPADSPLWRLSNSLVTPHVSGTSRSFWRRQAGLIEANLERYLARRPLLNAVNKQAGY